MSSISALVVLAALSGNPDTVLLHFSAEQCQPCRTMEPAVRRLEEAGYPLRRIDVVRDHQTTRQFHIERVPTVVLLVNGREVQRQVGTRSYEQLRDLLQQAGVQPSTSSISGSGPGAAASGSAPVVRSQSPDPPTDPIHAASRTAGPQTLSPTPPWQSTSQAATGVDSPRANAALPGGSLPNGSLPGGPASGPSYPNASGPGYGAVQQPSPGQAAVAAAVHQPGGVGGRMTQTPPASAGSPDAVQRALAATVRLRVEEANGYSYATGTIIDVRDGQGLVLTCGHVFRESKGQGTITADVFAPGAQGTVAGRLLDYDAAQRDIGLVVIQLPGPVAAIPVASQHFQARVGQPVFSIGCDQGASPSVRHSSLTAIDRYTHAPNFEVAGHPVDGRSGGGLFTSDGQLIGVCNAADLHEDKGLFASLPSVHWQLAKLDLSHLYVAENPAASERTASAAANSPGPVAAPTPMPAVAMDSATPASDPRLPDSTSEVICIVRTADGQQKLVVVNQATPELLEQIRREASRSEFRQEVARAPAAGLTPLAPQAWSGPQSPASHGSGYTPAAGAAPIVRAQSQY